MTISEHVTEFAGLEVEEYSADTGLRNSGNRAYRVSLEYDDFDKGRRITDVLHQLLAEPKIGELQALIIGPWDYESSEDSSAIIELLCSAAPQLKSLRALFIGDILAEEWEISWIQQSDISPLFAAFPELEQLKIRGADGLQVGHISHPKLTHLSFESRGLPQRITEQVTKADLPELTHLELWFGDDNYGYDGGLEHLAPILDGTQFPKLKSLGLKNSIEQDRIAELVSTAKILSQLEVLDLSMGNLTDKGAEALLGAELGTLKQLNLAHHYLSDEMMRRFLALPIPVNTDEQEQPDEYDGELSYYIAVSE